MSKGCQNGAQFASKDYRKSMPKHVDKQITKIMKNHFNLSTNMQTHVGALQIWIPKGRVFDAKMEPKATQNNDKRSQNEPGNLPRHPCGTGSIEY